MKKFFTMLEKKIKTKSDLIFYLENIDLAMEMIMKNHGDFLSEKLEKSTIGDLKNILLQLASEEKYEEAEQQIFFLQLLKKHILFLPQVKLEISFYPEQEVIVKIRDWFQKELGEGAIVDLIINPRVIGGAVIEYKGKLIDFSVAKKMEKIEIKIPS